MAQIETYPDTDLRERDQVADFVVIGAMRAGTTSLHNTLSGVDGLSLPRMKETDFFIDSKNWDRGRAWYESLFSKDQDRLRGEVCPNYAKRDVFPEVPRHIHALAPDIRIVYIVRDPVERAISHYRHTWISTGDVPAPDALENTWEERHILATSRYAWQLQPWLDFFDREQLRIIDFDTLVQEPAREIHALARHIGLDCGAAVSALADDNSSEDVARMPRWWHAMRNTPLGMTARSLAPTRLVSAVRSRIKSRDVDDVPDLSSPVRDRFKAYLEDDAKAFRKMTGLDFPNWSV